MRRHDRRLATLTAVMDEGRKPILLPVPGVFEFCPHVFRLTAYKGLREGAFVGLIPGFPRSSHKKG